MQIPHYPQWAPISLEMQDELHPALSLLPDGISEYTFAGLYLFRNTYNYHLTRLPDGHVAISGRKEGKSFFMVPCGLPDDDNVLHTLFAEHDYLKGLSERAADRGRVRLEQMGYVTLEDRDNFDYLYLRNELATLEGRRFHKKRNHVNAFINNYRFDERLLKADTVSDALTVLEHWHAAHSDDADYAASREALDLFTRLPLVGYIVYVDNKPAAYTLGEPLAKGKSFVVHFEKALDGYKGLYQFINKAFVSILPRHYHYINREQDLGNEGLRQAKLTYRPYGFVKKYRVVAQAAVEHHPIAPSEPVRGVVPACDPPPGEQGSDDETPSSEASA